MDVCKQILPWEQCHFVSLANAARIAGRSHGWVRRAVRAGELDAFELTTGGPPVVTVRSLQRFLSEAEPVEPHLVPAGRRTPLRVISGGA